MSMKCMEGELDDPTLNGCRKARPYGQAYLSQALWLPMSAQLWFAQRHKTIHLLTHSQMRAGEGPATCKVLSCNGKQNDAMAAPKGPFAPVQKKDVNWMQEPRGGKTEVTYPYLWQRADSITPECN